MCERGSPAKTRAPISLKKISSLVYIVPGAKKRPDFYSLGSGTVGELELVEIAVDIRLGHELGGAADGDVLSPRGIPGAT